MSESQMTESQITLEELEQALHIMLSFMRAEGYQSFDIGHDFYWDVPFDARYDVMKDPPSLTMGQMSDDISHVRALACQQEMPIRYSLVWIAAVLRAVGEVPDLVPARWPD